MIDIEYRHIGSAAHATLLYDIGGGIKCSHERNGTASNATGRAHSILFRSESRKGKTGASAAFMDQSGVFNCIKNGLHGILNRYDKAS